MGTLSAIATVALLSVAAVEAHAQVLVGAALGRGHQAAGNSDSSYLGPGFDGTSLAGNGMIDVVVGGGIAQRRTDRDGTFVPFNRASPSSPFHASLSDYVLAFTVGIDIAVGLTDRAALVGVGRLYQLKDDDRDASGVVHRGVSSTLVRYGGGLQFRF